MGEVFMLICGIVLWWAVTQNLVG